MKDYPTMWAQGLLCAHSQSIRESVTVVGVRSAHLGPRQEFARVRVAIEPAEAFLCIFLQPSDVLEKLGYPDFVIFGLLDILMVARPAPITKIKVTLDEPEYDLIHSSQMAFRQAGRDAGRRIMEWLNHSSASVSPISPRSA